MGSRWLVILFTMVLFHCQKAWKTLWSLCTLWEIFPLARSLCSLESAEYAERVGKFCFSAEAEKQKHASLREFETMMLSVCLRIYHRFYVAERHESFIYRPLSDKWKWIFSLWSLWEIFWLSVSTKILSLSFVIPDPWLLTPDPCFYISVGSARDILSIRVYPCHPCPIKKIMQRVLESESW